MEGPRSDKSIGTASASSNLSLDDYNYEGEEDRLETTTTLRLRIHATNLPRRGKLKNRLPDSFCVVTATAAVPQGASSGSPRTAHRGLLGTTEIIQSSRHPQWTETILVNYSFGTEVYFNVLLMEPAPDDYNKGACFGSAVFEVSDILGTRNRTRARRLRRDGGCIFCHLEAVEQANTTRFAVLRLSARDLVVPRAKFKVFSSAPDTVLRIARQDQVSGSWTTVYQSSPVYDSYSPSWDRIEIDWSTLCYGDPNLTLRFTVSMVREKKRPVMIGMIETTLKYLVEELGKTSSSRRELPAADDESLPTFSLQRNSFKAKQVGALVVRRAYMYEIAPDGTRQAIHDGQPSEQEAKEEDFNARCSWVQNNQNTSRSSIDSGLSDVVSADLKSIVQDGCELQFYVAIDFTSSNGDPRLESSLHYQSPSLNVYEETIASIAGALEDQVELSTGYTVWGFGAKFGDGIVRHIFQCGTETIGGVTGILDAYKNVFSMGFSMSGPTQFDNVLQATAVRAKRSKGNPQHKKLQYHVLLIITDGTVQDLEATRRKMSVYRDLPFSVIFVGVGRTDFHSLGGLCEEFDDEAVFVDFREVQSNPAELANAALGSLSSQILQYTKTFT